MWSTDRSNTIVSGPGVYFWSKMKLFNYIFVSDVLSRLFLACFFLFARDEKQNTNYDSRLRTQKQMGTQLDPSSDGSMNCFCPNLFQANMFQSTIFIMVCGCWKVGAMLSLWHKLGTKCDKLGQHDVTQTPDCSSAQEHYQISRHLGNNVSQ